MKNLITILLAFFCLSAFGQTFPVNNLTVAGTSSFIGQSQFTLSPFGPTPTVGDNSSKFATTAFVAAGYLPTAALTGLAPINSPVFTGAPTAPTPGAGTRNTQLATTAFVVQHDPCPSILDYGGNPGGVVDNTSALTLAIAASASGKVCVFFPAGIYAFSGTYNYTIPAGGSITFQGAGPDVTYLLWAANGGLSISVTGSAASTHIRDMTFLAGTTATGDAITLTQNVGTIGNPATTAPSDITNVTCRGSDGYVQVKYWSDCLTLHSVSVVNFTNVYAAGPGTVAGNGVQLVSTSTAPGVQYNFQSCTFNWNTFGIYYGNFIQGVTVNQSNFTGGNTGIIAPTVATTLDQLTVTNSQFNVTSNGILLQTNVPGTQITGNLFGMVVPSSTGITIGNPGLYTISGNNFGGNLSASSVGISLASAASSSGVITGNVFYRLVTGIQISALTGGVNVQSNAYNGNTTNVNNLAGGANTIGGGSP